MHKLLTLFILLISLTLIFTGAAAAAPQVNVSVVDGNSTPVHVTSPGAKVNLTANASTDVYLNEPAVLITLNPRSGLTFNESGAVMIYDGEKFSNEPDIFYWDDTFQAWIWYVGWLYGDQYPNEKAQLFVPATVTAAGNITVNADYMIWDGELDEPFLVANNSYTLVSDNSTPKVNGTTVPMQDTGAPAALAALGFLAIIGGAVYGKLR